MAEKRIPRLFVARQSFYVGGVLVDRGATVVEGHAMLKGRLALFEPFRPTYGTLEPDPEPEPVEAA